MKRRKAVAWGIQVEQTIEFPYDFVTNEDIKRDIVGRLESLDLPVTANIIWLAFPMVWNAVLLSYAIFECGVW